MSEDRIQRLRRAVRDVPDFPKPGVVFKDITPVLSSAELMGLSMDALVEAVGSRRVDKVVGIDARGFIFAAVVADRLRAGFIPVRKKGKLPWQTLGASYDLEYDSASVEIHIDALVRGERVLLVDDVLATGGTSAAALGLIEQAGGEIVGALFFIELGFLGGRARLPTGVPVGSILRYE